MGLDRIARLFSSGKPKLSPEQLRKSRPSRNPLVTESVEEGVTLRAEDIGHLHGGPAHDCERFRSRRERGITGGGATRSCSSGMGAAWRCRRDRWRYTVVCDRSAWPRSS